MTLSVSVVRRQMTVAWIYRPMHELAYNYTCTTHVFLAQLFAVVANF